MVHPAVEMSITLFVTSFSSNPFNATTPALRVVTNLAGAVTTADFGYQAAVLAEIVTIILATSSGWTKRWISEVGSSNLK